MRFYCYIYRDPISKLPRYVGKGSGSRAYLHLSSSCKNKQLKGWIHGLRKKTFIPEIEIIESIDEPHAFFLEECLIKLFGRLDNNTGSLFNHTDGGEGISGYKHNTDAKIKIGKSALGNTYAKNRVWTNASKLKSSISHTGIKKPPRTKEHSEKISAAHKGKICSPDELYQLQRMSNLVKIQIRIDGINYTSITDASKKLNILHETIRYRCKSKSFENYSIIKDNHA